MLVNKVERVRVIIGVEIIDIDGQQIKIDVVKSE